MNQLRLTKPGPKAGPGPNPVQRDKLETDHGVHGQKIKGKIKAPEFVIDYPFDFAQSLPWIKLKGQAYYLRNTIDNS